MQKFWTAPKYQICHERSFSSGKYAAIPNPRIESEHQATLKILLDCCFPWPNHQLDGHKKFGLLNISLVLTTVTIERILERKIENPTEKLEGPTKEDIRLY